MINNDLFFTDDNDFENIYIYIQQYFDKKNLASNLFILIIKKHFIGFVKLQGLF